MVSSAAQVSKLQRQHITYYLQNSARRFRTLLRVERRQVLQCMRNQVRCSDDNTGPWKALRGLGVLPCLSQAIFEVWYVQSGRNNVCFRNEIKLTKEFVISCPADSTEIGLVASRR